MSLRKEVNVLRSCTDRVHIMKLSSMVYVTPPYEGLERGT